MECGKQREATTPIQSLVKLQPWFLNLLWKTCLRQNCSLGSCACSEGPDDGDDDDDDDGETVISNEATFHVCVCVCVCVIRFIDITSDIG